MQRNAGDTYLQNVHRHQVDFMRNLSVKAGIAFLLILYTREESAILYAFPGVKEILGAHDRGGGRKVSL